MTNLYFKNNKVLPKHKINDMNGWNRVMLYGTGGTFTSSPTINKKYYVENQPV